MSPRTETGNDGDIFYVLSRHSSGRTDENHVTANHSNRMQPVFEWGISRLRYRRTNPFHAINRNPPAGHLYIQMGTGLPRAPHFTVQQSTLLMTSRVDAASVVSAVWRQL
jgi:hypothetical protein